MKTSANTIFLIGASLAVVALAIAGFRVMGPPSDERARRLDDHRVEDLEAVAAAVDLHWSRHGDLPASLDSLAAEPGVQIALADPATSEPYEYTVVDSVSYELCASFDAEGRGTVPAPRGDLWAHGAGRHCFALEAEEVERRER